MIIKEASLEMAYTSSTYYLGLVQEGDRQVSVVGKRVLAASAGSRIVAN